MKKDAGFTLMELLAVIAIIMILAGFLFPVFTGMRKSAGEGQCISNMHAVWSAVRQYRLDEGHYPDRLLEKVEISKADPANPGKTIKEWVWGGLYPEYIHSLRFFTCPKSDQKGDQPIDMQDTSGATVNVIPLSSYDGAIIGGKYEVHYRREWADDPADPDYRRQLSQRFPRDDTVITWCSYHRDDPANPTPKTHDIVVWLSGQVAKMDSSEVAASGWRTLPPGP